MDGAVETDRTERTTSGNSRLTLTDDLTTKHSEETFTADISLPTQQNGCSDVTDSTVTAEDFDVDTATTNCQTIDMSATANVLSGGITGEKRIDSCSNDLSELSLQDVNSNGNVFQQPQSDDGLCNKKDVEHEQNIAICGTEDVPKVEDPGMNLEAEVGSSPSECNIGVNSNAVDGSGTHGSDANPVDTDSDSRHEYSVDDVVGNITVNGAAELSSHDKLKATEQSSEQMAVTLSDKTEAVTDEITISNSVSGLSDVEASSFDSALINDRQHEYVSAELATNYVQDTVNETSETFMMAESNPDMSLDVSVLPNGDDVGVKSMEELCASVKEPEEADHQAKCELLHHDHAHTTTNEHREEGSCATDQRPSNTEKTATDSWLFVFGNEKLKKRILKPGLENVRPEHGQLATVRCVGRLDDGREIDKHDSLKLVIGDGDFIHAFDLCLPLMDEGEVCEVVTDSQYAYGTLGRNPDVPANANITYEIELLEYADLPEFSSLSVADRVKMSNDKRERGNYLYARNDCFRAIDTYQKAIKIADGKNDDQSESAAELQLLLDTRIKCYNNLAAAQLKVEAWDEAIMSCDQVLRVQPDNVKALFRKGKCLSSKGDYDAAIAVLRRAAKLEPNTKVIQQELTRLEKKNKDQTRSQKEMYQKMMGSSVADKKRKNKKDESSKSWILYTVAAMSIVVASASIAAYRRFG